VRPLAAGGLALLFLVALPGHNDSLVANGDTRTLSFHHTHRADDLTVTFKRNGRYDEGGLAKINHFLRDWRNDKETAMDPHLFDILWEVQRETGAKEPVHIVSAFRSPETNSMLRRRSRGVARFSQHMNGKAIDFFIPDANLSDLRVAGLRLQRGGVGFYPTSGSPFVHMDTGSVRMWPRMTRDQLARVFPDGKTVHLPVDGRPLAGYDVAAAEMQRRGRGGSLALASRGDDEEGESPGRVKQFFAKLFKAKDEDEEDAVRVPVKRMMIASAGAMPKLQWQTGPAGTEAVPLPRPRPLDLGLAQIDRRETTASLPTVITGRDNPPATQVLAYAPEAGGLTKNDGVPSQNAVRAETAEEPALNTLIEQPAVSTSLYAPAMVQYSGELKQPDLGSWRTLLQPAKTAVAFGFGHNLAEAPATRFAGPAVVALRVVAFAR
jgi:uncharacterized protein YcbK (DUF882 family)